MVEKYISILSNNNLPYNYNDLLDCIKHYKRKNSMSKAILFSRVSTPNQDTTSQNNELKNEAIRCGYNDRSIISIDFTESAIKLGLDERQGLQKLKEYIETDKDIDCVFIYEISRLSRQNTMLYEIRDFLVQHNVNLICLKPYMKLLEDGKMSQTASILFSLFSTFAESEMMIKRERFSRGKAELRQQCKKFAGAVVFGYTKDENKKCIPHPFYGPIVVDIFKHYANTDSSLYETYKYISTKHPDIFPLLEYKKSQHKIRHIFEVETYYKGNWCYPPLISKETWGKVHEKMDKARCRPRYECKRNLLCRGLIYCGTCGKRMTGSGGNTKAYVCCTDKLHGCQISFNVADWLIWERTKDIININASIDNKSKLLEIQQMINDREVQIDQYNEKLNENKQKEDKLLDLYLNNGLSKQIYTQKLSSFTQDDTNLEKYINLLEIEKSELEGILDETQKDLMKPKHLNVELINNFESRLEFVRRYISKMIVTKTAPRQFDITFEYTKPLVLIRYWFKVDIHNKKAIVIRVNEDKTEDDISDFVKF